MITDLESRILLSATSKNRMNLGAYRIKSVEYRLRVIEGLRLGAALRGIETSLGTQELLRDRRLRLGAALRGIETKSEDRKAFEPSCLRLGAALRGIET